MGPSARLVAATVLLCGLTACSGTGRDVSLAGDAHSSQDAQRRATTLLDRVYVPGAVRVSDVTAATPEGVPAVEGQPPVLVLSGDEVLARRSYTVLGRADDIVAALERQPPAGLETVTPPFESTATSAPLSTVVAQLRPTGSRGSSMQVVNVAASDLGGGRVGVDVRAAVGWVGARTPVETIPATVGNVQLAIGFSNEPDEAMNRDNQLTTQQVRELSARLNALPSAARDQYALCTKADVALAQFSLTYDGHSAVFDIQVGACDEVDVTVDGRPQPLLGDDEAVTQEVAAILNLTLPHV